MDTLSISRNVTLPVSEVELSAIRASGPGGQNVNKVSSAIHVRFDIKASSLPDFYKSRLLGLKDRRITSDGIVIIKAARFRTREKNRIDGLERLAELIRDAGRVQKARRATKPGRAAKKRRLDAKSRRSKTKQMRRRVGYDD